MVKVHGRHHLFVSDGVLWGPEKGRFYFIQKDAASWALLLILFISNRLPPSGSGICINAAKFFSFSFKDACDPENKGIIIHAFVGMQTRPESLQEGIIMKGSYVQSKSRMASSDRVIHNSQPLFRDHRPIVHCSHSIKEQLGLLA